MNVHLFNQNVFPGANCAKTECRARAISLLVKVAHSFSYVKDLEGLVQPVFEILEKTMGMKRGTVTLLDPETGAIKIAHAAGLSQGEQKRAQYQLGEGITGKVIKHGKSIVVPRIADEPNFLNRTGLLTPELQELSFICVAITENNKVIGALSVVQKCESSESLEEDAAALETVASLIGQAVREYKLIESQRKALQEQNKDLVKQLQTVHSVGNMVGSSEQMRRVFQSINEVAPSEATVLITGESGVGKGVVASAIHYNSPRSEKPFVTVNCAALAENLIESELFGHEKGAFTGALIARAGRFEAAEGGTIFLDEIGDLPLMTQVKLLRVIQDREYERLGSNTTKKCDVRIVAATNVNLQKQIDKGYFRLDLFYRLNVFPIHVPSLRERKSDIIPLVDSFIQRFNKQNNTRVQRISTQAIEMMVAYHWPGNIRELENAIERAMIICKDTVIHSHHLPPSLQLPAASGEESSTGLLSVVIENVERDMIIDSLKSTKGNMTAAARILGITERVMGLRVKRYGISVKDLTA